MIYIPKNSTFVRVLTVLVLILFAISCNTKKETIREVIYSQKDTSDTVWKNTNIEESYKAGFSSKLSDSIFPQIERYYIKAFSSAEMSDELISTFSSLSVNFLLKTVEKNRDTSCDYNFGNVGESYVKCLWGDLQRVALSSPESFKNALSEYLNDVDHVSLSSQIDKLNWENILNILKIRDKEYTKLVSDINKALKSNQRMVDVLNKNLSTFHTPWIGESFFAGKSFQLTTSIEQSSFEAVPFASTTNVSVLIVRISAIGDRLVVFRLRDNLNSAGEVDEIIASFPIVDRVKKANNEYFYKVDFSRPENRSYFTFVLQTGFGGKWLLNDMELDLQADVIIPKLLHKARATDSTMNSGYYFDAQDKNLVLDNLVLIKSNKKYWSPGKHGLLLGKNYMRPTVRIIQGFVQVTEDDRSFEKKEQLNHQFANKWLQDNGVKFMTEGLSGSSNPYFPAGYYFSKDKNLKLNVSSNIMKYDIRKEVPFVISRNTPRKVVPVLKAAVKAWGRVFKNLQPDGLEFPGLKVYTESEFEAKFSDLYRLPEDGIPAVDPRVNMIKWDETPGLSTAWSTFLSNPKSGKMISSDVFLAGKAWSLYACLTYFERKWERSDDKPAINPGSGEYRAWVTTCKDTLMELGIFTSVNNKKVDDSSDAEEANYEKALEHSAKHLDRNFIEKEHHHQPGVACLREAPKTYAEFKNISSTGFPNVNYDLIKDPKHAALSILKAVTIHELGHALGLRHNFYGSAQRTMHEVPFPVLEDTTSVMDYVDFAADINGAAMKDYSDPNGSEGLPEVGIYDYLAIGTSYILDVTKLGLDPQTQTVSFCTDDQSNPLSDCMPNDFGKDFRQNLFYKFNINIAKFKLAGIGASLALVEELKKQSTLLWLYVSRLVPALDGRARLMGVKSKKEAVEIIKLIVFGEMPSSDDSELILEDYLVEFEDRFNFPIIGLFDFLNIPEEDFKNPNAFLVKFDKVISDRLSTSTFTTALMYAQSEYTAKAGFSSDMRFHPVISDFNISGKPFPYATLLLDKIAARVMIPSGEEITFTKFGNRNDSRVYTLEVPFFNHKNNSFVEKVVDGAYVKNGSFQLFDIKTMLDAISFISPGHKDSISVLRLKRDRLNLACILEHDSVTPEMCEGITTKRVGSTFMNLKKTLISPRSVLYANFALDEYDRAIIEASKELPTRIKEFSK